MRKVLRGFNNKKLGLSLDVYIHEDREWFKAQDISEFLGYTATAQMTRNLDSDESHRYMHNMHTINNASYTAMFIDEYALYELILKVRKTDKVRYDKAKAFQSWVFGEVLPSIRRNDSYILAEGVKEGYQIAKEAYERALSVLLEDNPTLEDVVEMDKVRQMREKVIRELNEKVSLFEFQRDEAVLCFNDLRVVVLNMFAKRNDMNINVGELPATKQLEMWNQLSLEYPEIKDMWDKIIKIAKGEYKND